MGIYLNDCKHQLNNSGVNSVCCVAAGWRNDVKCFKLVFILSNFQRTMWDICRRFHWLLVSDNIISMIITYSWLSVIIYLLQLRCPFLSDQLPGFASLPVSWLFSCPFSPLTSDSCHSHTDWSSSTHFAPRSFLPVFKSSFNFLSAAVMHLMIALHRQINIPVKLEDNNVKRDAPHLNNEMNSYQSKMQII